MKVLPHICVRAALDESTTHEHRVAAVALLMGVPLRRVRSYLAAVVPPWRWHGRVPVDLGAELNARSS